MMDQSVIAWVLGIGLLVVAAGAVAAPPPPFTATYNVTQGDQPLGVAQVSLRAAGDGTWLYRNDVKGTGGLAAILGASIKESSQLRWKGDVPEAIRYDYQLQAAIKNKQRHLRVDWTTHQVTVDEGKGAATYPAQPGMVERNTLPLALGLALRSGQRDITLAVAVRTKVETQHFKVTGKQTITVPAGQFDALRVDRVDAERGFSAWYVPDRYLMPIKLSQRDGGNMQLELVSYQ